MKQRFSSTTPRAFGKVDETLCGSTSDIHAPVVPVGERWGVCSSSPDVSGGPSLKGSTRGVSDKAHDMGHTQLCRPVVSPVTPQMSSVPPPALLPARAKASTHESVDCLGAENPAVGASKGQPEEHPAASDTTSPFNSVENRVHELLSTWRDQSSYQPTPIDRRHSHSPRRRTLRDQQSAERGFRLRAPSGSRDELRLQDSAKILTKTAEAMRLGTYGAFRPNVRSNSPSRCRSDSKRPSDASTVDSASRLRLARIESPARCSLSASSVSSQATTSAVADAGSSPSRSVSPMNRRSKVSVQTVQNVRLLFYRAADNQIFHDVVEDMFFESLPPENVSSLTVRPLRNQQSMDSFLRVLQADGGRWSRVRVTWHLAGGLEAAASIMRGGICCEEAHCSCGRYGKGGYVAVTAAKANAYVGCEGDGLRHLFLVLSLPEEDVVQGERGTRPVRTAADLPNHPTEFCFVDGKRLHCAALLTYRWVPTERREKVVAARGSNGISNKKQLRSSRNSTGSM